MGQISLSLPSVGQLNSTEEPKIPSDFSTIQTVINGNLDGTNVATTAGFYRLVPTTMGSNGVAAAATLVGVVPGVTVTLPAPAANIMVGVYAGVGVTGASPVTVAGTNIYGVGLAAATSFKLGVPIAAVVLQSDGSNWFIVAGQQDTGWLPLTLGSGVSQVGGAYTAAVRAQGDRAYLAGITQNTSGGNINIGAQVGTVPVGARPAATVDVAITTDDAGFGAGYYQISTAGVMTVKEQNWSSNSQHGLDSSSYRVA